MKKNLLYNVLYQILVLILPLMTMPYVSRTLGAEGVGVYSYTYSIAYYFMIIAMLGLNNYGNRTIAKVRDNKMKLSEEFWSIYSFQLITSSIMIVFYLLYVFIFNIKYFEIALLQSLYVISSMFDINWFFFGIEKFKLTITRNTLIKVLSLILIFIFVKNPNDTWKYTLILSGSTLFCNIILISFLKKYVKLVKITKEDIIKHVKPNFIMFLPVIAVSIYKIMDKIMLGVISNVTEVGYYENAEKITNVPLTIIAALGTVMLPRASNLISNNQEETVKKLLKKTIIFAMFLAFPMVFGEIAIGKDFAVIFFGNKFEKSGILIQLLSITLIFLAWGNVIRTQYLIPKEMDRHFVISAFLGAIVNFVLNLVFIPKYASIGACIGTIAAEIIVALYQTNAVKHELEIFEYIKMSVVFLLKAIIMFIVIIVIGNFLSNNLLKIIVQVCVGSLLYLLMNFNYIFNSLGIKKFFTKLRKEII